MKTVKAMCLGLMLISGVAANATVLTFDEFNGANVTYVGTYDSNGFRITGGTISGIGSAYSSVFATGALFDNSPDGAITLRRIDGGAFSLDSIDMTRFPGYSGGAPINMLAFDASDVQVDSASFVLPDSTAFNHYDIGFANVYKVTWTQAFAYHAFDNITLDASVPEPATLMLVGLGLAGIGAARRRQPAA